MPQIVNVYRQTLPALRFIGKKYGNDDRQDGSFGAKWGLWFQNGWFDQLSAAIGRPGEDVCEDGGAYIGMMFMKEGTCQFEYWIGLFAPAGAAVPEGYGFIDFPQSSLAVTWVKGKEENGDIYGHEELCIKALAEAGIPVGPDKDNMWRCFERYQCPRFTQKDENGDVILDICFFL